MKNTITLCAACLLMVAGIAAQAGEAKSIEDIRVAIYMNTTGGAYSGGGEGMSMAMADYDILADFVPDFKPETLEGYDVLAIPAIMRYPRGTDMDQVRKNLRAYVKGGGGVVLSQESTGWRKSKDKGQGFKGEGLIPEVGMGTSLPIEGRNAWGPISITPLVVVDKTHPICRGLPPTFKQQYDGAPVKAGADGKAIIKYADDAVVRSKQYKFKDIPAVVAGQFGKGRAVMCGPLVGEDRHPREFENPPTGHMLRMFLNSIVWAAGLDEWEPFDIVIEK